MTKGIFISATNTDVGKTFVSALIVKKLKEYGINCGYYKPVLSGAEEVDGALIPGDCAYVKKISGIEGEPKDFLTYMFRPALSPHLASQIENTPINIHNIKDDFKIKKSKYDYLLVEGAGGICCPMNLALPEPFLLEHIIKALGLSVVIIAPSSLGSINSTVLTVEYAKNHDLNVVGIILNHYDSSDLMQLDNKLQIERLTGIPVIATISDNCNNIEIDKNSLLSIFKEI